MSKFRAIFKAAWASDESALWVCHGLHLLGLSQRSLISKKEQIMESFAFSSYLPLLVWFSFPFFFCSSSASHSSPPKRRMNTEAKGQNHCVLKITTPSHCSRSFKKDTQSFLTKPECQKVKAWMTIGLALQFQCEKPPHTVSEQCSAWLYWVILSGRELPLYFENQPIVLLNLIRQNSFPATNQNEPTCRHLTLVPHLSATQNKSILYSAWQPFKCIKTTTVSPQAFSSTN